MKTVKNNSTSFTNENELKCIFFSVVIKNESLEQKYKGGFNAFSDKYKDSLEYNNKLSLSIGMSFGDIEDIINDLDQSGLIIGEDYIYLNASGESLRMRHQNDYELGCQWLKSYLKKGVLYVSYCKNE